MAKVENESVVPVSKYARKKMNNATTQQENVESNQNEVADDPDESFKRFKKQKHGISPAASNYPKHNVNLVLIVKNNAEIRRFTSLGIINYLVQKGEINGNSKYVTFKWDKFAVICDGISREFRYTETFFLNALIAAFSSFSASAQKIIDEFCQIEFNNAICNAVNVEEINNIVAANEEHLESKQERVKQDK